MEKVRRVGWAAILLFGMGLSLSPNPAGGVGQTNVTPSPSIPWNIARIKAPQAWPITQGSPEIVVAVIDSGINFALPELGEVRWTNPKEALNGLDDDGNGYIDDIYGWDFRENVPAHLRRTPLHYHGTAVASVIAAKAKEVTGVAPKVRLMDVRFLDSRGLFYSGDWTKLARAIDYAVRNGARIINLSLHAKLSPPVEVIEALRRAWERGVIVVTIAGNDGREGVNLLGRLEFVLTVAATDKADRPAPFSNFGAEVDVSAPGAEIPALFAQGTPGTFSGTSFAAPHVSGALALILSANPKLSGRGAVEVLLRTSENLPSLDHRFGVGLVDAASAVAQAVRQPS
ncbi:MAG: S8 family serine peptidase [Candidatus Bipolaricaulota bacterium]|nr:S8 family serine peptidase [Candidatus Bipolaricaulota bacterium]MDW8126839.1 S8 family serine peptidase [Candidatus Bipolaricaulota bacterium]